MMAFGSNCNSSGVSTCKFPHSLATILHSAHSEARLLTILINLTSIPTIFCITALCSLVRLVVVASSSSTMIFP